MINPAEREKPFRQTDVHGENQPVSSFEINFPDGRRIMVRERRPGDFPEDGSGVVSRAVREKIAADFTRNFSAAPTNTRRTGVMVDDDDHDD